MYEIVIVSTGFLLVFGILTIWNRLKVIEKIYAIDQRDWDSVKGLHLQVERFAQLLNKLETLSVEHTIIAEGHRIEIENIKARFENVESRIRDLERKASASSS